MSLRAIMHFTGEARTEKKTGKTTVGDHGRFTKLKQTNPLDFTKHHSLENVKAVF